MYIPKDNLLTDAEEMATFVKRFSFGLIITAANPRPLATHLPFVVSWEQNTLSLSSHFAKANPQWKDIEASEALIVFSEPHAYISPSHYEKELNVPTWNYMAVHVYGKGKIITEEERVMELLERTIDYYESDYKTQWNNLPQDYKRNLAKGIVAFDVIVSSIEGKKKLSQNKTRAEQANIINALAQSAQTHEQLIVEYMKKELDK